MLILKDGIIYKQIYEYYKNEIIKGNYKKNQKLESKRNLARTYSISLQTVEAAYGLLLDEGYIYSKKRSGYFVSDINELYIHNNIKKNSAVEENEYKYKYDFSHSKVSKEGFPFKVFRKISSEIIYGDDLLCGVDYQGYKPLREEIALYLNKSRGLKVTKDEIIISSGTEYLFQIIFKLIDVTYAIEDPG